MFTVETIDREGMLLVKGLGGGRERWGVAVSLESVAIY